ncbi:MAG: hypothetical protein WCQ95_01290 [Bacteroidota bacterium]
MKKKIVIIGIWAAAIILFLVLVVYVINRYNTNKCRSVAISIIAPVDCTFISEDDVKSYISKVGDSLINVPLKNINVQRLESKINENPFVLSSKVYTTINGIVKIDIVQRIPIARVQNSYDQCFYISDDGHLMPLMKGKTARVLFVNGSVRDLYWNQINLIVDTAQSKIDTSTSYKTLKTVYKIAKFIYYDSFWKAQIQQLFVNANGDIELIPLVGKHIIIFGDDNNIAEKFDKLKIFYKRAEFINAWDKYDTININFKGQVVCS